jgi:vacuolar iron transporter family protein
MIPPHPEPHRFHRSGWLRAVVLGANDGIVSTASLIVGVSAAGATRENILLAGTAGLVAGAMSMAAGEYVSVKSQADTERADLAIETLALQNNPAGEEAELAFIYRQRGLDQKLAAAVARQLTEHNASRPTLATKSASRPNSALAPSKLPSDRPPPSPPAPRCPWPVWH